MRRLLLGIALAGSIAGCSVDIPDGTFACNGDFDCPNDFVCRCGSLDGTPACAFGCPASWPCSFGRCFELRPGPCDSDGDGHSSPGCGGADCADFDPGIGPRAPESPDGRDEDCDGRIDEAAGELCDDMLDNDSDFRIDEGCPEICGDGRDNDGDGMADEGCPGVEVCDGVDNDFDGRIDEGVTVSPTFLSGLAPPRWAHYAEIDGRLAVTYDAGFGNAGFAILREDVLRREPAVQYAMTEGDGFSTVALLPSGCPRPLAMLPPPPVEPPVGVVPGVTCETHAACDDGMLCNGYESCAPGTPGADGRGCVTADPEADPCVAIGGVCDERGNLCVRGEPGSCSMADLAVAATPDRIWFGISIDDLVCPDGTVRAGYLTEEAPAPLLGEPGPSLLLRGDLARSTSYLGIDAPDGNCTGASRPPEVPRGAASVTLAVLDTVPRQALAAWLAAPHCRSLGDCPADTPVPVEVIGLWLEDTAGPARFVNATGDGVPQGLPPAIGAASPALVAWPGGDAYFVAYPTAIGIAIRKIPAFPEPATAPTRGRRRTTAPIADLGSETVISEPSFPAQSMTMAIADPAATEARLGLVWLSGGTVLFRTVTDAAGGLTFGPAVSLSGGFAQQPSVTALPSGDWQVVWSDGGVIFRIRLDAAGNPTTPALPIAGRDARFPRTLVGEDGRARVVFFDAARGTLEGVEECMPAAPGGITDPCAMPMSGLARDCAWMFAGSFECEPSLPMTIGCNESCAPPIGACTGDAMIRVCDGADGVCTSARALGASDDACATLCPMVMTTCPPSGSIFVLTGSFSTAGVPATCNVIVRQPLPGG